MNGRMLELWSGYHFRQSKIAGQLHTGGLVGFTFVFNLIKIGSLICSRFCYVVHKAMCDIIGSNQRNFNQIGSFDSIWFLLIIKYPTVTVKCRTAIKVRFLSFNFFLSVKLENLSCLFCIPIFSILITVYGKVGDLLRVFRSTSSSTTPPEYLKILIEIQVRVWDMYKHVAELNLLIEC